MMRPYRFVFTPFIDVYKRQKLTYKDDEYLYIAEGFGTKETGGYSITVNQFYVKDKAMYFDTRLIAPDKGEKVSNQASYPYICLLYTSRCV